MENSANVTSLLALSARGDDVAFEQLFPILYDELHRLAEASLRRERAGHTLQPTALMNEAFLKLVDQRERSWEDERHFLSIAAMAMRRILINHANARAAEKRGGGRAQVTLFDAASVFEENADDLIALNEALERLRDVDEQKVRIVELRFFAGLTNAETARVLDVSERTVERGWRMARAWLRKEIQPS